MALLATVPFTKEGGAPIVLAAPRETEDIGRRCVSFASLPSKFIIVPSSRSVQNCSVMKLILNRARDCAERFGLLLSRGTPNPAPEPSLPPQKVGLGVLTTLFSIVKVRINTGKEVVG